MTAIFALLCLISCTDPNTEEKKPFIDPALQHHLDNFLSEANARGIVINTNSLHLSFSSSIQESGRAYKTTETILINPESDAWNMQGEQLVFHELAHIYLNRAHDERIDEFGQPVSLMHPDKLPFWNLPFIFPRLWPHDRDHYMDELFNPYTSDK